jgi:WD40 repeat protein
MDDDNEFLYSSGFGGLVKKWNLATGRAELTIKPGTTSDFIRWITLYDSFIFSAGTDGKAKQWDKSTGEFVRTFTLERLQSISSVVVSSDGRFLLMATTTDFASLIQFKLSDASLVKIFEGTKKLYKSHLYRWSY